MLRNQVAFRAVIQRKADVEFLCDADRGQDVIRAMAVNFERKLPPYNGEQRLPAEIACRALCGIVLRLLQFPAVFLRIQKGFAQNCSRCHTRLRCFV